MTAQPEDATFEALRHDIGLIRAAPDGDQRRIRWVDPNRTLAYARDKDGRLEIFLVGQPLKSHEPPVRERLVHDTWFNQTHEALRANRVKLPSGPHFDAAAAAILIELLDSKYPTAPITAFRQTEPLIALILGQAQTENAVLTGLAGELLTLVALLYAPNAPSPEAVLASWQGWDRSSRDFQFGAVGVEVKTSSTTAGRHRIQGWYQVEPGVAADGTVETCFYLLSIGIQWFAQDAPGYSIEGLANRVLEVLPGHASAVFLDAIRNFGGGRVEIDSMGVAANRALRRPFVPTYERLYDMADERIKVPRAADLARFSELITDSVSFEIELPETVRGDRNPITGFNEIVKTILHNPAQ